MYDIGFGEWRSKPRIFNRDHCEIILSQLNPHAIHPVCSQDISLTSLPFPRCFINTSTNCLLCIFVFFTPNMRGCMDILDSIPFILNSIAQYWICVTWLLVCARNSLYNQHHTINVAIHWFLHELIPSLITQSVLRQIHRLFQSEISIDW